MKSWGSRAGVNGTCWVQGGPEGPAVAPLQQECPLGRSHWRALPRGWSAILRAWAGAGEARVPLSRCGSCRVSSQAKCGQQWGESPPVPATCLPCPASKSWRNTIDPYPTPVSFVCLLRTQSSDTHPAHLFGSRASAFYCHQPQSFQQTGLLFPRAARSFGLCLRLASPSSLCFPSASFLAPCYVPTLVFLSILVPSFNLCNLVIYVYSCKHLKSFPEMLGRNPKYHFYLHPESGGGQTTSR